MSSDSLATENTGAQEHANVPGGSKQCQGAEDEVHPGGRVSFCPGRAHRRCDPKGHHDGSEPQCSQKSTPTVDARPAVSASGSYPRRCHHVEREQPGENIAHLRFHERHVGTAAGHGQHGNEEHLSSHPMPAGTFAEGHCEKARQYSQSATDNVKK